MNGFRVLDLTFALSLAFAPLVLPLAAYFGGGTNGPVVGTVVSAVVAVAVLASAPDLESHLVWKFGGLTFLVAAGVHVLTGTGANSGEAAPLVVGGVWVGSVLVAGAVVFRD